MWIWTKASEDLRSARLVRPTEKIFKQQLELVANYAELREDRGAEILAQINGGRRLLGIDHRVSRLTATSTQLSCWTLGLSLATHVEMRFKHGFACQRPVDLSPQIQPMIPTPGHSSWPSGHATEAYLTCALLQALAAARPQIL
jgi:membrane-associated phospholipid phosphatase